MATDKKKRKKLVRELKEARAEHDKLVKRVDKARAKYDKRATKLHALEQEIAHLEQHYYAQDAERMGQADPGHDAARPARLIYNPEAGNTGDSTKQLTDLIQSLRAHGIAAEVDVKTTGHVARELARQAVDKGENLVLVAGGDDTIEEVVRELVGTNTVMGILPIGPNNNLAQALGIPLELDSACALIGMGAARSLDAGEMIDAGGTHEYFLESVAAGLGEIDNGKSFPRALRHLDIPVGHLEIELDTGEVINPVTGVVTVSNAPIAGQNSRIAPNAKMDDGVLDVGVYEGMNDQEVLAYFNSTADQQSATKGPRFYRARRVRIESGNVPVRGVDSEQARHIEIKVLPQALATIVGNGSALSLPVQSIPVTANGEEKQDDKSNGKRKSGLPILGLFQRNK